MSQMQLLRTRRFLPLFIVQFLGAFNDNVFRFALIIYITFSLTEQSGIDARSLVVISGGIFILPFFLFSSLAGQIADKFEKSMVIRRVKLVEILVMGLGALGFWLQSTSLLFAILFFMGMQSTFFGPLKYGILPQHLEATELTGGNGLIQLGTYAAILLGAIAGGMLASLDGYGPVPVVSSVVALAVIGWLCAHAIPAARASDPGVRITWNLPLSTLRLLATAAENRQVFILILMISWFWFLGATLLSMVPSYGKELLNADERAVTMLNVAFTVGIGIGSLMCERLSRGRIELGLVPLAGGALTLFLCDFWFVGVPVAAVAPLSIQDLVAYGPALRTFFDLVMIGASGALFIVPLYAALQARLDRSRAARVIAALNVLNALFMVASALFTVALFAAGVTIPGVFGVVALMNVIVISISLFVLREFATRARAICCVAIRTLCQTPSR